MMQQYKTRYECMYITNNAKNIDQIKCFVAGVVYTADKTQL